MDVLLFLGLVILAVVVGDQRRHIRRLDTLIAQLLARRDGADEQKPAASASALRVSPPASVATAPPPQQQPRASVSAGPARITGPETIPPPTPVRPKSETPKISFSFEELVGGKLPIWIGGIALVLAAVFLVRYSVEKGFLGPAARTVIAGIFGLVLIAVSEAARRIERFAEDPRLAQALAGAGIASLYGTLYMAGELYTLIAPATTIALMAIVTAGALFLSLRHGPPTAIMGLVGGFTAPFLAEPTGSLVPLLFYLALLIAGLFAVAIQRGWLWLALAATGGGIVWSLGIMLAGVAGIGPSLGIFIVAVALAGTMLIPRTGQTDPRVRLLPIAAGFIQLAIFAPQIDFGYAGWGLYALLSGAALTLGYRDRKLMPANFAALGLVLLMLIGAYVQGKAIAPWAAIGATALFAVPGHLFARRQQTDLNWTILALGGGIGPLLVSYFAGGRPLLGENAWGALFALAAIPPALLSWRARAEGRDARLPDWALFGGAVSATLLTMAAAAILLHKPWLFPALVALAGGLTLWGRQTADRSLVEAAALLLLASLFTFGPLWPFAQIVAGSVAGARLHFPLLPSAVDAFAGLAIPAVLIAGMAWSAKDSARRPAGVCFAIVASVLTLAFVYLLAKQPLAISTDARFAALGFAERAVITQVLFVAAMALLWRGPPALHRVALAVFGLGLARLIWFDGLILNPLAVRQNIGALPVLNAVVVHFALTAFWLWQLAKLQNVERHRIIGQVGALMAIAATLAVGVRQVFQGRYLDYRGILTSENYAYSAGFLLLALFWLWRGIAGGLRWLRLVGLILLAAVSVKVFLIDAAVLEGLLRVFSFLGLGLSLMGIGWVYGRLLGREAKATDA